jgi:hypothetical protein
VTSYALACDSADDIGMARAPNDVRVRNVTLTEAITILTGILAASCSIRNIAKLSNSQIGYQTALSHK